MASTTRKQQGANLVAILLITRSRPGPKLVFHYPEEPDYDTLTWRHDTDSEDSDSESEDHDENVHRPKASDIMASIIPDDARRDLNGELRTDDETVLGRSVDSLEKVLSPGRWSDQKKFEINIGGLTFLGHPVYAREDGDWSAEKTEPPRIGTKTTTKDSSDFTALHLDGANTASPAVFSETQRSFTHAPDSLESQPDVPLGTSMQTTSSTGSDPVTEPIAMFHVVFVLRGKGLAAQKEINSIYNDVVKKLSKALHYCQKQADYVATQSKRLLSRRTKAKQSNLDSATLWRQMVETSELAWALRELYERISVGQVAAIRLNGMEMALHTNDQVVEEEISVKLGPLSAILLLESKENLLRELSHPDASPLATFIRDHTPTKNLQKHAAYVGMSVTDILHLATHLVKWRKARIITPLHQRNTYVVAPNAPISNLREHIDAYHALFPTLPNLPNMLKVLSGKSIKYGLLIPSRDHRTAYMNILSYLVRHDIVVQLKTYGWLKLPKSLLDKAVDEIPRRLHTGRSSLLSPRTRPVDEDAMSVSSGRTAIAPPSTPLSQQRRRFSRETQVSAREEGKKDGDVPVLVLDPREPTPEQSKLLDALQLTLRYDEDLYDAWPRLLHHLDGEHAFEEIAAREGLKRSRVEEWLAHLKTKGYLMTMRYI
jgi:hypothetical protein